MHKDTKQIVGAIVLAGAMIAGAILVKGSSAPVQNAGVNNGTPSPTSAPAPISKDDYKLGNPNAKVSVIVYEDYRCSFCGAAFGVYDEKSELVKSLKTRAPDWTPFEPMILEYVDEGKVQFVYRDFPFLGAESFRASEAARCASEQGKFWEYHDSLYSIQKNGNDFSDANLKSTAKTLGLNSSQFDSCLDTNKYRQAVIDSKNEGSNAGVTGTPKGFIMRDGKVVSIIDGAEPASMVKQKIESALK